MKIVVYTKTNNRYFLKNVVTLEHARERCKRIIEEGLLLEDYGKEEFYPSSAIYKVQIIFTPEEIEQRKVKYANLFPNWE